MLVCTSEVIHEITIHGQNWEILDGPTMKFCHISKKLNLQDFMITLTMTIMVLMACKELTYLKTYQIWYYICETS